jgi:hypothetical protein
VCWVESIKGLFFHSGIRLQFTSNPNPPTWRQLKHKKANALFRLFQLFPIHLHKILPAASFASPN